MFSDLENDYYVCVKIRISFSGFMNLLNFF